MRYFLLVCLWCVAAASARAGDARGASRDTPVQTGVAQSPRTTPENRREDARTPGRWGAGPGGASTGNQGADARTRSRSDAAPGHASTGNRGADARPRGRSDAAPGHASTGNRGEDAGTPGRSDAAPGRASTSSGRAKNDVPRRPVSATPSALARQRGHDVRSLATSSTAVRVNRSAPMRQQHAALQQAAAPAAPLSTGIAQKGVSGLTQRLQVSTAKQPAPHPVMGPAVHSSMIGGPAAARTTHAGVIDGRQISRRGS
ncbi:MAG: hypothetical protein QOD56_2435 [Gammaproteobacteria bacterium]|nr:hypothetical protein [Gammaproteobacteria bacterium]